MNITLPINKLMKAALVSSSILGLIVSAQAVITYTADFSGMSTGADGENNRSGGESGIDESIINQINPKAGANDLLWQSARLGYATTHAKADSRASLSIAGEGTSNQALHVSGEIGTASPSSHKGVMTKLPTAATLTKLNDSLSITFTGQFDDMPASTATLRLGFTMDDSVNLDSVYTNLGTGTSSGLSQSWNANNWLASAGDSAPAGFGADQLVSDTANSQFLKTDPFSVTFSVELIGIDTITDIRTYQLTTTVDDGIVATGERTRISTLTDEDFSRDGVNYFSRDFSAFDSFFIRSHGDTTPFINAACK